MSVNQLLIRPALKSDAELILAFISELAEYEHLAHEVVATPTQHVASLFGRNPVA